MSSFSSRHGYRAEPAAITVREDAPDDLRAAISQIAKNAGMSAKPIRQTICQTLLKRPDPNNWSDYPNVWNEIDDLITECPWFRVYDIAEALYDNIAGFDPPAAADYESQLNQFFLEHGIGWEMQNGEILFRGSEVFGDTTAEAAEELANAGHTTAANEVHEALRDISRRPDPDITGAIQHVVAALECTARDVSGQPKATLGQLIPQLDLPKPLDSAVKKLWGFASDRARHLREGERVASAEAELIVSVACAVCIFLSKNETRT